MLAIIHWELRMRSSPLVVRSPGASVVRGGSGLATRD